MKTDNNREKDQDRITRRTFVKTGGTALAGGVALTGAPLAGSTLAEGAGTPRLFPTQPRQQPRIQAFRTFGRTGFQVSDVGMGCSRLREAAVVRYAYDHGINLFDTAEYYDEGGSERAIGESLQDMDRNRIFIATGANLREDDDAEVVIQKVRGSLERLRTDVIDAYLMHSLTSLEAVNHAGYHEAMDRLKAEGRVRFTGVTYHGPGGPEQPSMVDGLCAAADSGRFDVILAVYNFLNHEDADQILAACASNNVGTMAMKTSPGRLHADPFDPENLTEQQARILDIFMGRGQSREEALQSVESYVERQTDMVERTRPFVEQYGIQTADQLRLSSIHWALQNPRMHTALVSFNSFDLVDNVVPLSGTPLTDPESELLDQMQAALDDQYCRHGCAECSGSCPHDVPVSTIMRYAYYYEGQGVEKHAMTLYSQLGKRNASLCTDCEGHCDNACPFGIDIVPSMSQVHSLLTMA